MLFSRWLARTTKRTLCSPTSTVPHAILPSHEGPSPPPSPRRSVKDVLTTPRKGCHETEHADGNDVRFSLRHALEPPGQSLERRAVHRRAETGQAKSGSAVRARPGGRGLHRQCAAGGLATAERAVRI